MKRMNFEFRLGPSPSISHEYANTSKSDKGPQF